MKQLAATPIESGMGPLTERLRGAIRGEAYEDVLVLLPEYNRRFEQALRDACGDLAETKRIAGEARELMNWARAAVLAGRAHAQAGLDRMNNAARYKTVRGPGRRLAEA